MLRKNYKKFILPIFSLSVFLFILIVVFLNKGFGFDILISENIVLFWGNYFDKFFVFLGNYSINILIGISVFSFLILYMNKRKKESFILIVGLILGFILEQITKFLIQRERPLIQLFQEIGYSFPSGHSIFSTVLFFLLIYFYKDKIKDAFFKNIFISANVFFILLVGFSRIYINAHWVSDVVGGWVFGLFISFVVLNFFEEKYHPKYL